MTAIKEYERLESLGLWRESPDAQRRDVIISIGDATLTIADQKGAALAHWSLPAVRRINPGRKPAVFGPGMEAGETLEIADDLMVDAISRVQKAIERRRPHPGRLRFLVVGAASAVIAGLAVFWLPGAMMDYAASVVPASKRAEIGERLLANIRRVAGKPCDDPLGLVALDRMHERLFGNVPGQIVVLSGGVELSEHLPGHVILLNRSLVEDYEDPEVPAGFALVEHIRIERSDPLVRLLRDAGLTAAFRLLTTGDIPDSLLSRHAENLLLSKSPDVDTDALTARFAQARLRVAPYAYALDISGESTIPLIEADTVSEKDSLPVLSDGDWISLQGVCGE